MAALTFTRYTGQLAAQLASLRRSAKGGSAGSSGQGQGSETGVQRIGVLVANDGSASTVYYDPVAHAIIYDDGAVAISQG